jgi:hypothetical protein
VINLITFCVAADSDSGALGNLSTLNEAPGVRYHYGLVAGF